MVGGEKGGEEMGIRLSWLAKYANHLKANDVSKERSGRRRKRIPAVFIKKENVLGLPFSLSKSGTFLPPG